METVPFDALIAALKGDETPRVPSLLVSVFGDLAQTEGSRLGAPVLSQLMDLIGVRPEAMRVALHRLRKDRWIDSQRNGRSSDYFLTDFGRAESAAASPRIYSVAEPADEAFLVVTDPSGPGAVDDFSGVWVSSNVLVASRYETSDPVLATRLKPDEALPDWMARKICDPSITKLSSDFAERLRRVQAKLSVQLTPFEMAALRVLIVHDWRRIVLKTPSLPDHVFPKGWCGRECRLAMADLLARVPKPPLDALCRDAAA